MLGGCASIVDTPWAPGRSGLHWPWISLFRHPAITVVNTFHPRQLGMGELHLALNGNSYQTHPAKNGTKRPEPP